MDIFDQVREIRPTYPTSPQAPRRALHQEIARSRRSRPLRRIAVVSLGGAAVAAAVVTAIAVAPPGVVSQPQAASAAEYLTETAASIRAAAAAAPASETTAVTITTRHLGMVGGPNTVFAPFGDIRAGATGAVVSQWSGTYRLDADGTLHVTDQIRFHSTDVYGDEAAVATAWNDYYGSTEIGPLGTPPVAEDPHSADSPPETLPVSPADFPHDPAAFLEAWTQGMRDLMDAEIAESAELVDGDLEESGILDRTYERYDVPAAEHMLSTLATSTLLHTGSPEYRATFLEALALAPGITVEEDSTAVKVLAYASDEQRYRLSIDPAAGAVVQIDEFLLAVPGQLWNRHTKDDPPVEVGSAPFLPDGIPSRSSTFRSAPAS
ncbi:hypothetical protein [Microbacterium sufflavum]|uniref:CU044_5270 family protein n=1 Tax=Microbacterium sufflavum TaxID=2851649 RepID=A0ABY4IBL6_9MICO|nr:hypothetical protein [Microbacterium sufflavum]UPL09937.1 hypothetical protein KV394_01920 [Microbacterium sufflavum]